MHIEEILNILKPTIDLLRQGSAKAGDSILKLGIVDTPEHLAMPPELRHLIWDIYELTVLDNAKYVTKEEILENYTALTRSHLRKAP